MRRFEFVEGTSSKFWEAGTESNNFIVVYGRIGTAGQRKEKAFPTAAAAEKELEKKIAEKVREGYKEVSSGAPAPVQAPTGPQKPVFPPRFEGKTATAAKVDAAVSALAALEAEAGGRSWRVSHKVRKARRALESIAGTKPSAHPALQTVLDAIVRLAAGSRGTRRIAPRIAVELLGELDASAFERAVGQWKGAVNPAAATSLSLLCKEAEVFDDGEVALHLALVLVGGGYDKAIAKRWKTLAPLFGQYLTYKEAGTLEAHLKGIDPGKDRRLSHRLHLLRD